MKNRKLLLLYTIAVVAISSAVFITSDVQSSEKKKLTEIKWYDYESGWEKAKLENKHMFVDFTATWCGWCKKLERTTFSRPEVIEMINNNFVPVKVWDHIKDTLDIDGYKIANTDLIKREFRVTGFPSLWFVSPEGVRVGPAGGYIKAERLLSVLDIVKYYRYDSTRTETGEKIKTKDN